MVLGTASKASKACTRISAVAMLQPAMTPQVANIAGEQIPASTMQRADLNAEMHTFSMAAGKL
eukprot:7589863-Pyramimonas_sp.AAC.1